MSKLRAVLDQINDLEASIHKIEGQVKADQSAAVRLTLRSLESRRESLQEELDEVTRQEFVEVCDYRIIPAREGSYAIAAVTSALRYFQDLVTLVFDAKTTHPKQRATSDPLVIAQTRLDFGFAYAGSLGIVMTIPNERLLSVESNLDESVGAVMEIMKASSSDDIGKVIQLYGFPTVKKLYSWSKTHSEYDMSAEIKWVRDGKIRKQVFAQPEELEQICRIIDERKEPQSEPLIVTGQLDKWDRVHRSFILSVPDADPISGTLADDFDVEPERRVPHRYTATLQKLTTFNFSEGYDRISWVLEKLEEID